MVADAFRAAIADTTYYKTYFDRDDAHVPADVVLEYIRAACLCQLQTDGAPDRPLLRDAFLHAGATNEATSRRATLRFLLELADQTAGHALNEDRFRQLIYYRADGVGAAWQPREAILRTARRWRLYQAREYYAFAFNRLWRYVADWGQSRIRVPGDGVPLATWWAHVDESLEVRPLAEAFGVADPGLDGSSPLSRLATWGAQVARVTGNLDSVWDRAADINEHDLYQWATRHDSPAVLPAALTILALVADRLGDPATEVTYADDWDICRDGAVSRLSMQRFFTQWRRRCSDGTTIAAAARWLLGDYVIRQHERVAAAKLAQTGDTFRFRRQGDELRFYQAFAPATMNSSRFQALATVVSELGLVGSLSAPGHTLTLDGQLLLAAGDL